MDNLNNIIVSLDQTNTASPEAIERARLRRNQRNSRARKQAYIQDLEQRWGLCVQQGAQATKEMQKEAQRVQEENRLLRMVLRTRLGLSEDGVQKALEEARRAVALPATQNPPVVASMQATGVSPGLQVVSTGVDRADMTEQQTLGLDLHTITSTTLPRSENETLSSAPLTSIEVPQIVSGLEKEPPPTLDLLDWLDNLCQIKDAFGAETLDDPFDYSAVPLEELELFDLDAATTSEIRFDASSALD